VFSGMDAKAGDTISHGQYKNKCFTFVFIKIDKGFATTKYRLLS